MAKKLIFNLLLIGSLISIALIGLYWLQRLGVEAGAAYLWLFVIGLVFVMIPAFAKLISNEDFYFEVPFDKNPARSVLMFILGCVSIAGLFYLMSMFGQKQLQAFSIVPLAQLSTGVGAATFSALQAVTSNFWVFFITVFSAAVIEEFVLGFGFMKMGAFGLGYGLRKMLKLDFGDSGDEKSGNQIWDFSMALVFSVVMFSVLHYFNNTYVDPVTGKWIWGYFIYAAMFRLVLNIFIYKFGNFGLLFSIGVHATHNAILLGAGVALGAFLSFPGGVILSGAILLILFFAVTNFKSLWKEGELTTKDFIGGFD